jgi:uncharacterized protein (DUF1015 family)
MRLFAFEGLRYGVGAGDAGRLAAPPYDQIDDAARDRFQAASPYQFVHLTRPVATGAGDPYRHAAELHRRWLRDGIVFRDEQPSLYPYVVELSGSGGPGGGGLGGGRRLGVMALVGYAPASEIRLHEQTLDKPLADRLALLEATRVDLEPALLLAEDGGELDDLLAADLEGRGGDAGDAGKDGVRQGAPLRPLVDYRDDAGNHHLLFRIADPGRIAAYQHALAARPAAIADGHHRYKVGQRFAAEHPGAAGTAAGAKLAVVTSMSSRALTIDPIHRALRQPIDPALFADLEAAAVPFRGGSGAELARAVAAAPQPALGVWVAGRPPEIWRLLPAGTPHAAGAAGKTPSLVVKIFQDAVLPALGLAPEAATDGTLVYRSDADTLYAQLERGELGTGFWLPPMRPADFAAAIAQGELLPPKSTRFLPKAMSGLVWSDHQSQVT